MYWKHRRVFVTGAGGFIGSHLVRRLAALNADVCVVLRPEKNYERIDNLLSVLKVVRANLGDKEDISRELRNFSPTNVFHVAAYGADRPFGTPYSYVQSNVSDTALLLEECSGLSLESFVHMGTSAEYGGEGSPFSEDGPLLPGSPYGASKAAGTCFALMYHQLKGLPVSILRPFQVYGPGQDMRLLIPHIIRCVLKSEDVHLTPGEQVRDFVFVSDVVDGMLMAAERKNAVGTVLNLGSGEGWRIRDLAEKILSLTGSSSMLHLGKFPYRDGEIFDMRANPARAISVLGWKPRVAMEEGLNLTIEWYKILLAQESIPGGIPAYP